MRTNREKILLAVNPANAGLKEILSEQNFQVMLCDSKNAMNDIIKLHPDLILLESDTSEPDAFELCYRIKNHPLMQDVLVVMVSDREEEYLEAAAFNAGTNDYIIKPLLRPLALLGRIKSLLKKNNSVHPTVVQKNGKHTLRIDQDSFAVYLNNEAVNITKKEFDLLILLSSKPGKLFTRKEIYQSVWNKDVVSDRTIDVHIRRLRVKIGDEFITTQKGVGYRFSAMTNGNFR